MINKITPFLDCKVLTLLVLPNQDKKIKDKKKFSILRIKERF